MQVVYYCPDKTHSSLDQDLQFCHSKFVSGQTWIVLYEVILDTLQLPDPGNH